MNLEQFSKRMADLGNLVEQNSKTITQKVAYAVVKEVVEKTPVDTGQAKSNWRASLGSPITEPRGPFFPGKFGSTALNNTTTALDAARRVIAQYQSGGSIYFTNNLAYIELLNQGHSKQAPAGFVEAAVDAGIATVRASRVLVVQAKYPGGWYV